MDWTLITNDDSATQVFNFVDEAGVKEVLRYNLLQRSARIFYAGNHKLFLLSVAMPGTVFFKNEYGFYMGSVHLEFMNTEGSIIIENRKFHYQQDDRSTTTALAIWEETGMRPMASCRFLNEQAEQTAILYRNKKTTYDFAGLLLGLCRWLSDTILSNVSADYQPALLLAQ